MDLSLTAIRLTLGLVFGLAALAKLLDREATPRGLADFGIPDRALPIATRSLPALEAAIAVMILLPATSRVGAAAGAALLTLFTAAIAYHLSRGRRPGCRCFGELTDTPIGLRTVVRNGILLGLAAGLAVGGPGLSTGAALRIFVGPGSELAAGVALLAIVAALGATWIAAQLWRLHGRLVERIELLEAALPGVDAMPVPAMAIALSAGDDAPEFILEGIDGVRRDRDALLDENRPLVLAFVDPACGPCDALLPRISAWQREETGALRLVPVFSGEEGAVRARAKIHRLHDVQMQREYEVAGAFGVPGTPSAVAIGSDGRMLGSVAVGAESIARMVAGLAGERAYASDAAAHSASRGASRPALLRHA